MVEKIPSPFNVEKIFASIQPLMEKYPAVHRAPGLGGWAIQSTNGSYVDGWSKEYCPYNGPQNRSPHWNPSDPREKILRPIQDFILPTEFSCPELTSLVTQLEDWGLNPRRARIIKVLPGYEDHWHQDGVDRYYQARVHLPLYTNSDCAFVTKEGPYHMAADNSFYFVHINRPHTFYNRGTTNRYHFVCHIWDQKQFTQFHNYDASNFAGPSPRPKDFITDSVRPME